MCLHSLLPEHLPGGLLFELLVVQVGVVAAFFEKIFVRALLDDLAAADDEDQVRVADPKGGA